MLHKNKVKILKRKRNNVKVINNTMALVEGAVL